MLLILLVDINRLLLCKTKKVLQLLIPFKKSNTIWVDKGSEFYNRSMKSNLQGNNIEIHAAQ